MVRRLRLGILLHCQKKREPRLQSYKKISPESDDDLLESKHSSDFINEEQVSFPTKNQDHICSR